MSAGFRARGRPTRYVALGDSVTEGVGDADHRRPHGWRGWADRVAEELAGSTPVDYANLAVSGRKVKQVVGEQVELAIALDPDLVTVLAGGNDLLGPRIDLDAIADHLDEAVVRLTTATSAQVVLFTLPDLGEWPVLRPLRPRVVGLNARIRTIAVTHGTAMVDLWRIKGWVRHAVLGSDRLHVNTAGHRWIAAATLDALGIAHGVDRTAPLIPATGWLRQRADDLIWFRTHLAPRIARSIAGRPLGANTTPRYPDLIPVREISDLEDRRPA